MTTALLDHSLGHLACSIPGATRVLHQFKLDFCCAGHQSLRQAASLRGIDAEQVARRLEALSEEQLHETDWRLATQSALIAHILQRFHARHRQQLPELIRLASRVEQVHGRHADCPVGLAEHLWTMQHELESHMLKEEQVLFPLLEQGLARVELQGPISVLRLEHEQHGAALTTLEELTRDITPPEQACNTWRALYRGLEELRSDLTQHIHLENNILFTAASVRD